jgi:uncharacterized membrane protein YecN with MAPEG domain
MGALFRKQMIGVAGALAAALTLALLWLDRAGFGAQVPVGDDTAARLGFVATWLLLPGIALLIGVVGAARRGFYADAIDGTRNPASPALEINLRYNTNTVEQVVLAAIAWGGLAMVLPHAQLALIPVLSVVFLIGRVTFFIGYLITPIGRAYGMVLTILPTYGAYLWLTWRLLAR